MTHRPPAVPLTRLASWLGALLFALFLFAQPAAALAAPGWSEHADIAETGSAAGFDLAVDGTGEATLVGSWLATVGTASRGADGVWSAPDHLANFGMRPQVALAPDGTATAVWIQSNTGYEVWTATRDASGEWSEAELLSAADASDPLPNPQLVIDRAGNATAAWVQDCSLYSARRPANGVWSSPTAVWTDPEPVEKAEPCIAYNLETGSGQTFNRPVLDLGVDAAGNVTVVWRSGKRSPSSSPKTIRAAVRPAGGSSSWSDDRVIAAATVKPRAPEIQVWDDGRAIVTWGIETLGARAAVRPAGADQPFGAPQSLSEAGSPDPTAAYDGHGNATVVWDAPATAEEPATLRAATLDGAGAWGPSSTAASFETGTQPANPRLVVSQAGDAILAWALELGANEFDEYEYAMQTVRRPAGGGWEAVTDHGKEQSGEVMPALAGDALGNATIAWGGDGLWKGFPTTVARTADYTVTPPLRADWTANGLTGSGNLRSWINYLVNGGGGVEASAGASRPDAHDRYSYRLGQSDAWIEPGTNETVVQLQGTIGFKHPSHFIDIRIVDPQVRIAADGGSARLLADGQGSGDMMEAIEGNPQVEPFEDVHLLDLSLPAGLTSRDGSVRSWIGAEAEIAGGEASHYLAYPAGTPYGFFTFSAPASPQVREEPQQPQPPDGGDGGGGGGPAAGGGSGVNPPPALAGRSTISSRAGAIGKGRIATVATVACGQAACAVRAPKRVRVKLAGQRFWAKVLAPKALAGGEAATVRVKLPRAALELLGASGAKARLAGTLRLTLQPVGGAPLARTLKISLRAAG